MKGLDFSSPEQIMAALKHTPPQELREIIVSMATLEPEFSATQIAARVKMNVRDVRRAMRAGEMPHPIFGAGYFCRGTNSKKVAASQVNAWRRSFFVQVDRNGNGKNGRKHGGR